MYAEHVDWVKIMNFDVDYLQREADPKKYEEIKRRPLIDLIHNKAERYFSSKGNYVDPNTVCNYLLTLWSKDDWHRFRSKKEPIKNLYAYISTVALNGFQDYENKYLGKKCDPPKFVKDAGEIYVNIHEQLCCYKRKVNEVITTYNEWLEDIKRGRIDARKKNKISFLNPFLIEENAVQLPHIVRSAEQKFHEHIKGCFLAKPVGESENFKIEGEEVSKFDTIASANNQIEEEIDREQSFRALIELANLLDFDVEERSYEINRSADTLDVLRELLQQFDAKEVGFIKLRFYQDRTRSFIGELYQMNPSAVVTYENRMIEKLTKGFREAGFEVEPEKLAVETRKRNQSAVKPDGVRQQRRGAEEYLKSQLPERGLDDE